MQKPSRDTGNQPERAVHQPPSDGRQRRAVRTRTKLLEATEALAARDGVGAVTLERVAIEAGVSKGGLLYHFASKQELLGALLIDTLQGADERLEELTLGDEPGAFARAYLEYVRTGEHNDRGVATGIFASAALDEGELSPARAQFTQWQDRLVNHDGLDPSVALLARVVGDGLWLIDLFGLASPSDQQRDDLIELVLGMLDQEGV